MFKAIVLLALVAIACGSDPLLGGYYASQDITQAVVDTAEWATNELTTTYNYAGEYHIANIRDYTVQVVSGTNRRFTVDYVVVFGDNNYRFVSCKYGVYEILWQNYREIFEGPTCTDWIPN